MRGSRWLLHLSGTVLLLVFVSSCNDKGSVVEPLPAIQDGHVYVVAGQAGLAGDEGDEGPAVDALLYWPQDVTPLPNGDLLVMDWNNHRVRRISPDGIIHHFIGSGQLGDTRKQVSSIDGRFNHPMDIKLGPDGNYWMAGFHNWCIYRIDGATLDYIETIGDTTRGYRGDYPEHEGSIDYPVKLRMDLPSSIIFDPAGNLYFSDQGNTRIRKIDINARVISLFVGGTRGDLDGVGDQAQFALPGAQTTGTGDRGGCLELAPNGQEIYMVDTENHKVKKINIATSMVTTIAGTGEPGYSGDGGPALAAQLNYPQDITCSANGDIYIAESHNHIIRKIDTSGIITTVAGTGVPGNSPDGTLARVAQLKQPTGVAFDNATNTLYIADAYNQQIKMIRNP